MNISDAIDIVAGYTEANQKNNRQANLQRRNGVTDLYGITETRSGSTCKFYMSVSPDMTYLSRFSFKLDMEISAPIEKSDFTVTLDGVDITSYTWEKLSFPISSSGIYPSETLENDFDILKIAGDMKLAGSETEAQQLVTQGLKKLVVSSSALTECTLISYIKYSNLNR